MDILEIMKARHSVRQYSDKKIENEKKEVLADLVKECNNESGLSIQIIFEEPKCFDSMMAHYGKFCGVENYIALENGKASARAGKGFYTKMDFGIVKYHFEAVTGRRVESWQLRETKKQETASPCI